MKLINQILLSNFLDLMLGTPVQLNLDKYSITSTESIPWLRAPDRKPSQRLTFIKQSLSQEDSQ